MEQLGVARHRRGLLGPEPDPQLPVVRADRPALGVRPLRGRAPARWSGRTAAVAVTDRARRRCWPTRTVDAVAIATPAATHTSIGLAALDAGKHVLVEKPLAPTVAEGRRSWSTRPRERNLVLMCDHTYCYTPVVQHIRRARPRRRPRATSSTSTRSASTSASSNPTSTCSGTSRRTTCRSSTTSSRRAPSRSPCRPRVPTRSAPAAAASATSRSRSATAASRTSTSTG